MRIRRCPHFVPGANDKMPARALDSAADALVLDLGDAVLPSARTTPARSSPGRWPTPTPAVMNGSCASNPVGTPWFRADVEAPWSTRPTPIWYPRGAARAARLVDRLVGELERRHGHPVGGTALSWAALAGRTH